MHIAIFMSCMCTHYSVLGNVDIIVHLMSPAFSPTMIPHCVFYFPLTPTFPPFFPVSASIDIHSI